MRRAWFSGVIVLAFAVLAHAPAFADDLSACISACEQPAIACSETTRDQKYVCVRGVRESCRSAQYAQLAVCMTAASKACTTTHNPLVNACDQTFVACHKACYADAPITKGYWCRAEANLGEKVQRKTGYCELEQSQQGLAACQKRFEIPAEMGSIVLSECQPL